MRGYRPGVVTGAPSADPVLRALRSSRWLLVVGAVVGAAAGGAVHLAAPAQYSSTVVVELTELAPLVDLNPAADPHRQVSVDTDAQLVVSDDVVGAVADAGGLDRSQVRSSLAVEARPLTRVLEITYTSHSQDVAAASAGVAADSFLQTRERLVIQPVQDYLLEVGALTSEGSLVAAPVEATGAARGSGDTFLLETRQERALGVELAIPGAGRILEGGRTTAQAVRGDVEVPVASGAAVGAMLGLLAGLIRQRVGRRA